MTSAAALKRASVADALADVLRTRIGTLPATVHDGLRALRRVCRPKSSDWRNVGVAHAEFHEALVAGAQSPRIEDAYRRLTTELNLFLVQLGPVWSRRRMIDQHRTLVLDLEATGDLSTLLLHLEDGLEAFSRTLESPMGAFGC